MLSLVSLVILALAVSLDGFGVGIMYGLRKIRIPPVSIAIISGCSGLVIYASMKAGAYAAQFVSPVLAKWIGAVILIGIGLWAIVQMRKQRHEPAHDATHSPEPEQIKQEPANLRTVLRIELKRLGLVIEILRSPSLADMDRSGIISSSEAVLLGTALSLDAFGAGIGAAFMGFPPLMTALMIALSSGLFISTGLRVGLAYADTRWLHKISMLPGFILIAIGIMRLM